LPRVDAMRELRNVDLKRLVALKQRWRVSIAFLIQQTREPGLIDERRPDERLFVTESGHRLHATAFKRTLVWATTSEGRRIHDLRHTAALPLAGSRGRCGDSSRRGWGTHLSRPPTSTATTWNVR